MSRRQVLAAQPRLALGALLTLLLAAGAVVGSGADFTASSANPANTFASGTLSIANSKEGTAVLTASNLRPAGPEAVGTVDIENDGSLDGAFSLSPTAPVDSDPANPLSEKLNLVVVDCGEVAGATAPDCGDGDDTAVYDGTPDAMGATALGSYDGGEKHRYEFTVGVDGSAGNAHQGGVGDVITYRLRPGAGPENLVTHRIVAIGRDGVFRTKGDANEVADPWTFRLDQPEQARVRVGVPWAGHALAALGRRDVRMVVIALPALLIAGFSLARLWRQLGLEARKRAEATA